MNPLKSQLPLDDQGKVDRIAICFEMALQGKPSLDEYLALANGARPALLIELVLRDLGHRIESRQDARIEDYLGKYPELADDRVALRALVKGECEARGLSPAVARAEYGARFPALRDELGLVLASASDSASSTPADDGRTPSTFQPGLHSLPTRHEGGGEGLAAERNGPSPMRYKPLRLHARGGLGEVFVAEDLELHREVALKEIRGHHAANPDSRRRFVLEAEITGGLEHPGIVPVYGLGAYDDGRPFYAMRFIHGDTLSEAIKKFHRHRNADGADSHGEPLRKSAQSALDFSSVEFRGLLRRFIDVCNAVAYAHSRGVLHRDLKPNNVMLGKFGETLVVDWGLAKVVDRAGGHDGAETQAALRPTSLAQTASGAIAGTPAYMSPEQAGGQTHELGPATDIYSLGATLYVLLTGKPPMTGEVVDILCKTIDGNFAPPRTVNPAIPAALDAICRKAMARKAEERYATPLELVADLEHWLADEAVSCCGEPLLVKAGRWGRKHRTLVTSTAGMLLISLLAVTAGLVIVGGLNAQLETANGSLDTANNELSQKNTDLVTANANEKTERERAEKTLDFFVASLRRPDPYQDGKQLTVYELLGKTVKDLDANASLNPSSRLALLNAIGRTYGGLGEYPEAIAVSEVACRLAKEKLGDDHPDTLIFRNNLAAAYEAAGKLDLAITLFENVLKVQEAKLGDDHPYTLATRNNLAGAYHAAGKLDLAIPLYERTLQAQEAKLGDDHFNTLTSRINLAGAYLLAGRLELAITLFENVLKASQAKLGDDHRDTLEACHNLAGAYHAAGLDLAIPLYERTLKAREAKLGDDHPSTVETRNDLAGAYRYAGKPGLAIPLFESALKAFQAKLGNDHPRTLRTSSNLASTYRAAGKLDLAIPLFELTLKAFEAKLGEDHPDTLISRNNLAAAYEAAGKQDLAIPLYERTLQAHEAKLEDDHPNTLKSRSILASAYYAAGKWDLAIPLYERTLQAREAKLGDDHSDTLMSRNNLATAYLKVGKLDLAIPLLERTLKAREAKQGDDHPGTLTSRNNLARAFLEAKRPAEALPLFEKFIDGHRIRSPAESPQFAGLLANVAFALLKAEQFVPAEKYLRESLAIREKHEPDTWTTFNTKSMLGGSLAGQCNHSEAEPLLLTGFEGMSRRKDTIPPQAKPRLTESLERLVNLYDAWNKPDEAARWRAKLVEARIKDSLERDYAWPLLWGSARW